jgi:hypothetical protein
MEAQTFFARSVAMLKRFIWHCLLDKHLGLSGSLTVIAVIEAQTSCFDQCGQGKDRRERNWGLHVPSKRG